MSDDKNDPVLGVLMIAGVAFFIILIALALKAFFS